MAQSKHSGRIITFYSFKGGVGRTMTLANVAFLAAMSGLRVLVMDWDLEAPGLAQYFRGLTDPAEFKELMKAPGILNAVWNWRNSVRGQLDEASIVPTIERFKEGLPFAGCARRLVDPDIIPKGAAIDYIGCGTPIIETPEQTSYQDALANFSWAEFFQEDAGGHVIEGLRTWASANYDVTLIDSRTGFADVAGLCTMQLPDEVALCFILNRQNIEGVSDVARSIRNARGVDIRVRVLPMRVARINTSEEADARAKALADLVKVGGLVKKVVNEELTELSVPAADNVPFYESLAAFAAIDAASDVLTSSYRRVAKSLLGREINAASISPSTLDLVKRRLRHRRAPVEYVERLQSAEPSRAIAELSRLVESSIDSIAAGDTEDNDYVDALYKAVQGIDGVQFESEYDELRNSMLALVRTMANGDGLYWRDRLIETLQERIEAGSGFQDDSSLQARYDELDSLLGESGTFDDNLKRLNFRIDAAWDATRHGVFERAFQLAADALTITEQLQRPEGGLNEGQEVSVLTARADLERLNGRLNEQSGNFEEALSSYEDALRLINQALVLKPQVKLLSRMAGSVHTTLALRGWLPNITEQAAHAVQAMQQNRGDPSSALRFPDLARVVCASNDQSIIRAFCDAAFVYEGAEARRFATGPFLRQPNSVVALLRSLIELLECMLEAKVDISDRVINGMLAYALFAIQTATRRSAWRNSASRERATTLLGQLIEAFLRAGAPDEFISELQAAGNVLRGDLKLPIDFAEPPSDEY